MIISYQEDKDSMMRVFSTQCYYVLADGVIVGQLIRANANHRDGWYFYQSGGGEDSLYWVDGPNPEYSAKEACRAMLFGSSCPGKVKAVLMSLERKLSIAEVYQAIQAADIELSHWQLERLRRELCERGDRCST